MLSDNIKKYRKENSMSQDELAEKLGVSRQSISLWENGQTQPTIDNIIALAKIFNISTDAILENTGSAKVQQDKAVKKKKNTAWLTVVICASVVFIICIVLSIELLKGNSHNADSKNNTEKSSAFQSDLDKTVGSGASSATSEDEGIISGNTSSNKSKAKETAASSASSDTSKTKETAANNSSSDTAKSKEATKNTFSETQNHSEEKQFDLFSYCKNFAIQKGKLNGDYCIYQQPATRYGGYQDEHFSISYWGDSDMVEFCLHCPLDETLSINFYLRMRGGYNKKYEYLSSLYYRDSFESLRSATGYINPSLFSDNYPLSCDKYEGSFDGQDAFMEESRVGLCDLIHCLKKFVEVEKMECGFSAFEFVNF